MNKKLTQFLQSLKDAKIYHSLERYRDDAISVIVVVPGQRWEVDFLDDGSIDIERFLSNGELHGEEALEELFAKFSECKVVEKSTKVGKSIVKKHKRLTAPVAPARHTVNR